MPVSNPSTLLNLTEKGQPDDAVSKEDGSAIKIGIGSTLSMSKLFGEYLVSVGAVTDTEIEHALQKMSQTNLSLGALAVKLDLLNPAAAKRLHRAQKRVDRPFGEIAVALGFLSEEQLANLLKLQKDRRVRIGESLVQLGYLTSEKRDLYLQKFEALRKEIPDLLSALKYHPFGELVNFMLIHIPRLALRLLSVPVQLGPAISWNSPVEFPVRTMIEINGPLSMKIGIAVDTQLAEFFEDSLKKRQRKLLHGLSSEQLGDFLTTLSSHALRANQIKDKLTVTKPLRGEVPEKGIAFQLISNKGNGVFIVHPIDNVPMPEIRNEEFS